MSQDIYDLYRSMRAGGVSALNAFGTLKDTRYVMHSRDYFLRACESAMQILDQLGASMNQGVDKWDCDDLSFALYAILCLYHKRQHDGPEAWSVGIFPYQDATLGPHVIIFQVREAGALDFYDGTRRAAITPTAEEIKWCQSFIL